MEVSLHIHVPEVAFKAVGEVLAMNCGSAVDLLIFSGWRRRTSAFYKKKRPIAVMGITECEEMKELSPRTLAQKENCTGSSKLQLSR